MSKSVIESESKDVDNDMAEARNYPKIDSTGFETARASIRIIARDWWLVVTVGLVIGVAALGYSLLQKPVYEATATLYVTSAADDNAQSAYQGSLASQQRVLSYTKLVSSDAIVRDALNRAGIDITAQTAKTALKSSSAPNTVLLNVSAQLPSSEDAAGLANAVAASMTNYVATLEQPSGGGQPLAKLTVVTPAALPVEPVSPATLRNTMFGVLAGLIVGAIIVLVRDRLDNRINSETDIAKVSSDAVLSMIPIDEQLREAPPLDFGKGVSAAAEAYRRLRTNLEYISVDLPVRRILVTSPNAGEGKTTTSLNLAAALAEAGHRVVLLGADLRKPTLGPRVNAEESIGFTTYLRGDIEIAEVIQRTKVRNLDVIVSGPTPPNPAELLGSQRASQGVADLRSAYDYVIIDSAPILPVSDATISAAWADGVLIVASSGVTKLPQLSDAISQIEAARVRILGFVLNFANSRSASYAYSYYGYSSENDTYETASNSSKS